MKPQCEVDCVGLCSFESNETEYCRGMENSPNNDYVVVLWLLEILLT